MGSVTGLLDYRITGLQDEQVRNLEDADLGIRYGVGGLGKTPPVLHRDRTGFSVLFGSGLILDTESLTRLLQLHRGILGAM
jgi:hypothetical protein